MNRPNVRVYYRLLIIGNSPRLRTLELTLQPGESFLAEDVAERVATLLGIPSCEFAVVDSRLI